MIQADVADCILNKLQLTKAIVGQPPVGSRKVREGREPHIAGILTRIGCNEGRNQDLLRSAGIALRKLRFRVNNATLREALSNCPPVGLKLLKYRGYPVAALPDKSCRQGKERGTVAPAGSGRISRIKNTTVREVPERP